LWILAVLNAPQSFLRARSRQEKFSTQHVVLYGEKFSDGFFFLQGKFRGKDVPGRKSSMEGKFPGEEVLGRGSSYLKANLSEEKKN